MNSVSNIRWVRFGTLVVVCGALSACDMVSIQFGGRPGMKDGAAMVIPPVVVPVETAYPTRGDISTHFETTTRVEAERRVDVAAKSSARCISILVDEGDRVTTGQVLAELERDEAEASYRQSDVLVRQNWTSYKLAKKQYDEGLGAKVEMDNALYTHEQSEATLESQRIALENLTIRSPIDGVVTSRDILEGMLVSVGTQVFSIMDPESFMLTISPPEKELPRLKVGQRAKVRIDSIRGQEFVASIRRISPSVDPVSGTVKVVLDFEGDVSQVHESAFARVRLVMATIKDVLLAPKEAIIEENGRQFVFVAQRTDALAEPGSEGAIESEASAGDGSGAGPSLLTGEVEASEKDEGEEDAESEAETMYTAERIEVRTGLEDNDSIQVYSGLNEDSLLITNGQHTLKSGALIRIANTAESIRAQSHLSAEEALAAAQDRRQGGSASVKSK